MVQNILNLPIGPKRNWNMLKKLIRNTVLHLQLKLNREDNDYPSTACDFDQACKDIQPGDLLLVEGRSAWRKPMREK